MSKLTRKENNLRKAQARFDRISNPPRWKVISHFRNTEFQLDYRREQNKNGKFRTHAYIVRDTKSYHGNNKGILHKAVNLKYRVKGDTPSFIRTINSLEPKTRKGKLLQKTVQGANFVVHDVGQTVVDTALAAETVGLKSADAAQREVRNKLRQKYTREAVDDYHKGIFFVEKTSLDAVKGTRQHFKQKKQFKLEKAKHKLQKSEYRLFKAQSYKPKIFENKNDLKAAKEQYKAKIVKGSKSRIRKGMNLRRKQAYKQSKRELRFERKQLKTEKKFKVKELHIQRKIRKNASPGLLVFKPAKYSSGRMKASAWQKAVNEDQDNDVLHAIDSAKRRVAEPVKDKVSKPQRLQRQQKKRDRLSDEKAKSNKKLNKQENKLNDRHDSYKKRKKKRKPDNKNKKKTVADGFKNIFQFIKNVYEKEVKKFFGAIAVPVIIILLVFAFVIMIFSSILSGGGFTLGTYAAQDYDLSEAEKYYTELAWNFNEKILTVSNTDKWKDGLAAFGAKKKDLKDDPDTWYWGRSDVYNWDPVYDFDCYKLWSFLCAYYYDFSASDNGDIKYWKFNSDTEKLLDEIFKAEYEFVYWYDDTSHWEELNSYEYDGQYHWVTGSGIANGHGYVDFAVVPNSLSKFSEGSRVYFNYNNGEILNFNDSYASTGYYFQDQRYIVTDPNGAQINPFYQYDTSAYQYTTSKGFGKHYVINNTDVWMPQSYWSFEMSDGRSFQDVFCVEVSPSDVAVWKYGSNVAGYIGYCSAMEGKDLYYDEWGRSNWIDMCKAWGETNDGYYGYGFSSYYKKYKWVEDCRLYYNVKQKKTFDEVIEDKLGSMSDAEERLQYYQLLVGNDSGQMYGNHQTPHNLLSGDSIRGYSLVNGFGYDVQVWNTRHCAIDGLHEGIDVAYTKNQALYAPFDCEITDVDEDNHSIVLRKNDVEYWYDGSGGTKRDTEVYISNANLIGGLEKGDTIKEGEQFATSTGHEYCDEDIDNNTGIDYVHIKVKVDTDGYGWDFIDPRLVLY